MNDIERWLKSNKLFHCQVLGAKISSRQCKRNREVAIIYSQRYMKVYHNSDMAEYGGPAIGADRLIKCAGCKNGKEVAAIQNERNKFVDYILSMATKKFKMDTFEDIDDHAFGLALDNEQFSKSDNSDLEGEFTIKQ